MLLKQDPRAAELARRPENNAD